MSARPPQIVAFGGGGFSMEWGNPLLDDHVLSLTGVPHPQGVLPADRERRRRSLRRPLLPGLPGFPLRAVPHLAVPARDRRGRSPGPSAGPGPHLRGRGQPRVADGDVAGSRARFGAARGVAGRGRPVRRLGRLPVLVLARRVRLSRRARAAPGGAWVPALEQRRALLRRAGPPDGVPPRRGRRDAARLWGQRRRCAALRRHRSNEVVSSRPEARARYVFGDGAGRATERELPVRYLGAPRSPRRQLSPADGLAARRWPRESASPAALRRAGGCGILEGSVRGALRRSAPDPRHGRRGLHDAGSQRRPWTGSCCR